MALLFMDSGDHYATADVTEKWTATGVGGAGATTTIGAFGRRSSSGWRYVTGTTTSSVTQGYLQRTLAVGDATGVLGFAFSATGGGGTVGAQIAGLRDGSSAQITLRLNSDLTLSVLRGTNGGTVLGTTVTALTASTYSYLELKVLIHLSAGTVDLRVNGVSLAPFPLTGQNTRNTAVAQWTSVLLGSIDPVNSGLSGVSRNFDYDDLYVLDGTGTAPWNTFLGDCRVDCCYPTAEGTSSAWTPSTGSDNALTIDETAPNDDTDYNSSSTTGQTDTFVTQDAPVAGATLYGIQHCLAMKKSDAGLCTVAPVIRHSSVDYPGADLSPATSYAYGLQIAQTNPGTSAQWTESGFNSAEFGYKRTS